MLKLITTYSTKILVTSVAILLVVCVILSLTIAIYKNKVKAAVEKGNVLQAKIDMVKVECEKDKLLQISKMKQLELDFLEKSTKFTQENLEQNRVIKETIVKEQQVIVNNIERARNEESFAGIWVNLERIINEL